MARRRKSTAEGLLLILGVIAGAIALALEAMGHFLRAYGGLIIGLLILAGGGWLFIRLVAGLFRILKKAVTPARRGDADSVRVATAQGQPVHASPVPDRPTQPPVFPDLRRVPSTPVVKPPPPPVPEPVSRQPAAKVSASRTSLPVRWVPPGESIRVHGLEIPGGMLYVGTGGATPDASQIDPALTVRIDKQRSYDIRQTSYWPSYRDIAPEARGAYLAWLADGKNAPTADIGFVFLYFYGLERRLLLDSPATDGSAEIPLIRAEIRRLLGIYGYNGSFSNYANSLLDCIECRSLVDAPLSPEPPDFERTWHIPFELKFGLAKHAATGLPLPGAWAFAWWKASPEARIRTPLERCPDEFRRLFIEKYHQVHGAGLRLKPNKTRLAAVHRPASPSFNGRVFEVKFDLPDVTVISGPMKKFAVLAEECYLELDRYSRHLGRTPDNAGKIDALLELPTSLWPSDMRQPLGKIHGMVAASGRSLAVRFEKLRSLLPAWQTVSKTSYAAFARSLGEIGLGIEPDPRFGGACPKDSETVVLFVDAPEALAADPSPRYQTAALSLHLAVAVSLADGEIGSTEREVLMRQLEDWLHLESSERLRLQAYLRWLVAQPPGLSGLKKRIEALPVPAREALGDFLVRVAHADGKVAPAEVKLLEKLFKLLELDAASLYSKLHAAPTEPVTVRAPAEPGHSYVIPPRPPEKPAGGLDLDFSKISTLEEDSQRVSQILHAIFEDSIPEAPANGDSVESDDAAECLWGLTPEFSEFVRVLLTRPEWSRAELEELATDRSLMLDGALEHINEAAFELFDQPLTEGDDPLEINLELAKETAE
jgi:tellurite resistance protein